MTLNSHVVDAHVGRQRADGVEELSWIDIITIIGYFVLLAIVVSGVSSLPDDASHELSQLVRFLHD